MPTPVNDSVQSSLYRGYSNDNDYITHTGLVVMPVSDGPPVVLEIFQPYGERVQRWAGVKDNTPPAVPGPRPNDSGSTLIGQQVTVPLPQPLGSDPPTYRYSLGGAYTYVEPVPTTPATGYPGGKWPMVFPGLDAEGTALMAVAGGLATPRTLPVDFLSGKYSWPFTAISVSFFDPSLS